MIQYNLSHAETRCSIVDLRGPRQVFANVVPGNDGDLAEQTHDALRTLDALADEEGIAGAIVHQAVFLRDVRQIEACRQIMRVHYSSELPATSYIPQPPCSGKLLEIEVWGVGRRDGGVEIRRLSQRTVTARHNGVTWVHCEDVVPETSAKAIHDRSWDAFRRLEQELATWGFSFDQVVRTWLYLDGRAI